MPSWVCRIGGSGTGLTQAEQDNNILCIYGELKGNYNWTDEAIAGACGCFHEESGFNPGIYETSHGGTLANLPYFPGGMGLAQWTDYPAYTGRYPNPLPWCADMDNRDWWDGSYQCYLMTKCTDPVYTDMGIGQGARWGWQPTSYYPSIPFNNYTSNSSMSVDQATEYWFYDFEWHSSDTSQLPASFLIDRQNWARYAYDLFHGLHPDPPTPGPGPGPGPTPTGNKKMPLWMMLKPYRFY